MGFMKEIEVKILEINRKTIEQALTGLGAKKILDGDIQTTFFDFKDGRIIKAKDVLRIRKEPDRVELTYKKVHVAKTAKTAEEYSVEISNLETMRKILENLGLSVKEDIEKHRISYALGNIELIHKYAALLGFKAEDCLPWSTEELIRHYSSKKSKNED